MLCMEMKERLPGQSPVLDRLQYVFHCLKLSCFPVFGCQEIGYDIIHSRGKVKHV